MFCIRAKQGDEPFFGEFHVRLVEQRPICRASVALNISLGLPMQPSASSVTLISETDRLFAVIGRIVVSFQQIELWVSEALSEALGLSAMENRYVVQSAMSFRQKVDLLMELLARSVDLELPCSLPVARRALGSAEEFRNGVVHTFWGIGGMGKWVRTKPSLKGKHGFVLRTSEADLPYLEEAADALTVARDWEIEDDNALSSAIEVFSRYHGQA